MNFSILIPKKWKKYLREYNYTDVKKLVKRKGKYDRIIKGKRLQHRKNLITTKYKADPHCFLCGKISKQKPYQMCSPCIYKYGIFQYSNLKLTKIQRVERGQKLASFVYAQRLDKLSDQQIKILLNSKWNFNPLLTKPRQIKRFNGIFVGLYISKALKQIIKMIEFGIKMYG